MCCLCFLLTVVVGRDFVGRLKVHDVRHPRAPALFHANPQYQQAVVPWSFSICPELFEVLQRLRSQGNGRRWRRHC